MSPIAFIASDSLLEYALGKLGLSKSTLNKEPSVLVAPSLTNYYAVAKYKEKALL